MYRTLLCVLTMLFFIPNNAHAFWESIKNHVTILSVRNQRIQIGISNVLSAKNRTWYMPDPPTHIGAYLKFKFYPYKQEAYRYSPEFIFSEMDFTNYPDEGFSTIEEVMQVPHEWYSFNAIQEELRELNYIKKTDQEIVFEMIHKNMGQSSTPFHVLGRIYQVNPKKYQVYFFRKAGDELSEEDKEFWIRKIYKTNVII